MSTNEELYARIEAAGHVLERLPSGKVDRWAMDMEPSEEDIPHNGPRCTKCWQTWCVHCNHHPEVIPTCKGKP